jgi:hypothetical protein
MEECGSGGIFDGSGRGRKKERRVQIKTTGVRLKNGRVIRASLEILAYLQYQSVH